MARTRVRARRKGRRKARAKGRAKGRRERSSRSDATSAESGTTELPIVGTAGRNRCTRYKVELALPSSSQSTGVNDVGDKEIELIDSVQEEEEETGWIFMIAETVAINQLSMDGAYSLVVDSGASVLVCPRSYVTHALLQALPGCWRRLDLRSASGKMLKVWSMREVAFNAMDQHGKVFSVKIPFVVCEARRPLLSVAMLEKTRNSI